MTEDFLKLATKKFTKAEIEATGAKIEDINQMAFLKLIEFRESINCSVHLIFNGITTGNHKSPGHPSGRAFDIRVPNANSYDVFKVAIDAGFKKIGIYWNGNEYSYHLEDSKKSSFWSGKKDSPGVGSWKFSPLIVNPRD